MRCGEVAKILSVDGNKSIFKNSFYKLVLDAWVVRVGPCAYQFDRSLQFDGLL